MQTTTDIVAPPHRSPDDVRKSALEALQRGLARTDAIKEAVYLQFGLSPNWHNKTWSAVLVFLKLVPEDQTVEKFAAWWYADWRGQKGSPPTASQIKELWQQAFRMPTGQAKQGVSADLQRNRDGSIGW